MALNLLKKKRFSEMSNLGLAVAAAPGFAMLLIGIVISLRFLIAYSQNAIMTSIILIIFFVAIAESAYAGWLLVKRYVGADAKK
ncbi:MAG: hypothetical protein AAFP85_12505 [Pseudomonadota bacterium]